MKHKRNIMELTIFLVWVACLLSYSSSINQRLLNKPINKNFAWPGFTLLLGVALMSAMQWYITIIAALYIFSLVMMFWIAIIIIHGHFSNIKLPLIISTILCFTFLLSTGGLYAA